MRWSSYYIKTGLSTFFFAFLATLVAGLSLFFLLTRRLRQLSSAVSAFEQGKFNYRISISGSDELTAPGRAFNEMTASIEAGVEKIRQTEQQRSDLITNISHDLRSPLTSIKGHLETILLKDLKLTDKEGREYLEISLKNVSGFQKLVEELFELAKLESSQIKPEKEPFQFAELKKIESGQSILKNITVIIVNYDKSKELKRKYGVTYQHTYVQIDRDGESIALWNGGGPEAILGHVVRMEMN